LGDILERALGHPVLAENQLWLGVCGLKIAILAALLIGLFGHFLPRGCGSR